MNKMSHNGKCSGKKDTAGRNVIQGGGTISYRIVQERLTENKIFAQQPFLTLSLVLGSSFLPIYLCVLFPRLF